MKANPPRAVGLGDLGQLTLRANVAFAVRCAMRVRPWLRLSAAQLEAMDAAIEIAVAFCRGFTQEAGQAVAVAGRAAVVAEETCTFTRFASYGPVRAAEAVVRAEECVRKDPGHSATEVVAAAFGAGRVLAANADESDTELIVAALSADAAKLRSLSKGTCVDLGSSFDPTEAGPLGVLWAGGAPPWYEEAQG